MYGEADPYGYALRNCTSFVAWMAAREGVDVSHLGDAQYWFNNVGARFQKNTIPAKGAIVWWRADPKIHPDGHVAYVSNYDAGTNTLSTQEYNGINSGAYAERTYDLSTTSDPPSGYIHIEKAAITPPGGTWDTSTFPDGTVFSYGSYVTVTAQANDNGNGGLTQVNITEKVDGGSWQVLKPQSFGPNTSSAIVSASFYMPIYDIYVSFDVYSNDGLANFAPNGELHYCTFAPCQPASSGSGVIGLGGGGSGDNCVPGADQASVFTDANFGGQCQVLDSGYYPNPSYLSLPNDSISSVKVGSGAQLELCRDDNYSNTCEWFSSDNADLSTTSIGTDQASSSQVISPNMPTCTPGVNQVSFFVDANFQGQCVTKDVGVYNDANAIGTIPDNSISSVKVGGGVKLEMCQDNNLSNTCQLLDTGDFDFGELAVGNDQVSSAAVIANGSPPSLPSVPCVYDTTRSGILLYQGPNYTGGCVFLTSDITDLTSTTFAGAQSLQILGTYQNYFQAIGYSNTNFGTTCGVFTSSAPDLGACDGALTSIEINTYIPAQLANNIASDAQRDQPNSGAAVDNDLSTEWVGGHQVPLSFIYSSPQTIQEIVVFDRAQSASDNNQENSIQLTFSDNTQIKYINMISGGPRCADVRFPAKAVSWVVVEPYDASGNNGFREVQIWDNSGTVHSSITCPNIVQGSFVPMSDGKLPQFQNVPPTVADSWYSSQVNQTGQLTVSASLVGNLPITLSASGLPAFATFADHGDGTGTLSFAPQSGQAGQYDIAITASNGTTSGGGVAHVTIAPPPIAPTATLSVSPASGLVPVSVVADASTSVAGSNPIASYTFDFGDGTVVGPQASATATHVYSLPGTYAVTATVMDSIGLTNSATQSVSITATPPTASLRVTPAHALSPVTVTADASGSVPGSLPIATYRFDFGDGTTVGPQASATATHEYLSGGKYTVTVTVTDTVGQSVTMSTPVVLVASPTVFDDFHNGIGAWTVSGNVSAGSQGSLTYIQFAPDGITPATASRAVGSAALSQYRNISIGINLYGATLPNGTGAQFFITQGGQTYSVSLAQYVDRRGLNGWQTLTIPISDFISLDKTAPIDTMGFSFAPSQSMTVAVDNITFTNFNFRLL
jgi:hypothetical protein